MSISLLLIPVAIALGSTVSAATVTATASVVGAAAGMVASKAVLAVAAEVNARHIDHLRELYQKSQNAELPPMESIFTDIALLEKTLREHGLAVEVLSENKLVCTAGITQLEYARNAAGEPFFVTVKGVEDVEQFFEEMACFEREYRQNVQSFTYNKLMDSLAANHMTVAEETVLEDNSILLTIDL